VRHKIQADLSVLRRSHDFDTVAPRQRFFHSLVDEGGIIYHEKPNFFRPFPFSFPLSFRTAQHNRAFILSELLIFLIKLSISLKYLENLFQEYRCPSSAQSTSAMLYSDIINQNHTIRLIPVKRVFWRFFHSFSNPFGSLLVLQNPPFRERHANTRGMSSSSDYGIRVNNHAHVSPASAGSRNAPLAVYLILEGFWGK
jgi:hypothetical protein